MIRSNQWISGSLLLKLPFKTISENFYWLKRTMGLHRGSFVHSAQFDGIKYNDVRDPVLKLLDDTELIR